MSVYIGNDGNVANEGLAGVKVGVLKQRKQAKQSTPPLQQLPPWV